MDTDAAYSVSLSTECPVVGGHASAGPSTTFMTSADAASRMQNFQKKYDEMFWLCEGVPALQDLQDAPAWSNVGSVSMKAVCLTPLLHETS
jgi:hypothetical protein